MTSPQRGSDILGYTPTYGDRAGFLSRVVPRARATAGVWFDWAFYAGACSDEASAVLDGHLHHPQRMGIQFLQRWPENRGQHHANAEAFALAKALGYRYLLRIDDDVEFKTVKWLKKMIERKQELESRAQDTLERLIVGPKVCGLRNPPPELTTINIGQNFRAVEVPLLGGACRLASVAFLEQRGYKPDLLAPVGRRDPQHVALLCEPIEDPDRGLLVQFPDIRVLHDTAQLERTDSAEAAHRRRMGWYWPWIPPREARHEVAP